MYMTGLLVGHCCSQDEGTFRGRLVAYQEKVGSSSNRTLRFLAEFVGTVSEDLKLMLILCYMEDLVGKTRTSLLERLS